MAYKQSPLAYSRTSNMPGLEYSEEDLAQKERIASNALGITPPADLLDGEFFLKDNDPQDFYRTLYIKRGESLDKVVTFTDTGKAIFDGINIVNLDDDEEVTGVLPKKKIITAAATVQIDNISTIIGYDGNKFQELKKNDFVNKVVDDVNAGIDLANYFNKETDILDIAHGGTGTTVGALPFSSRVKAGIVVSDDFSIDLNVGDLISILFKGITKEQIIQTYVQNGTYLLHWFRQRKDTKELSDNNSIVKVVTPSTKTDTWNGTYEGMCNIIRIK